MREPGNRSMILLKRYAPAQPLRPGDAALQFAAIILGFMAFSYLALDIAFVFGAVLTRATAILFLAAGVAGGLLLGALFGVASLPRTAAVAIFTFVVAAVTARYVVDISYDGQDYHYTAIWALVDGWNFYHNSFDDHVAPGSDREIWAPFFPKAAWAYNAIEVAAGVGYEAAKTQTLLLAAATGATVHGIARRIGAANGLAIVLALVTAANPIVLQELYSRMTDGVMAGYFAAFLGFAALGILGKDWRATLVSLVTLAVALNSKQSAILILAILCAALCVATLMIRGMRSTIAHAALLLVASLIALFVIGADPYLRNVVKHCNPVYPMRGAPNIVIDDEFRPPALAQDSEPVRLARSLAARTSYEGPTNKIPFAIGADEFALAGDPEVFLGGFGPWFSGVLLLTMIGALGLAIRWPGWRSPTGILVMLAIGTTVSAFAMPESWAVRYVPQLWLVPILLGTAMWSAGRWRWLAAMIVAAMAVDSAIVAASVVQRQGRASIAIEAQADRLRAAGGSFTVDPGASPARIGLLEDRGLRISPREGDAGCVGREALPLAHPYEDNGERPGIVCAVGVP